MADRERTRIQEPEPEQQSRYEQAMLAFKRIRDRVNNPYVIRGRDQPWVTNRQGRMKYYSHLTMDNAVLPNTRVFKHEIADKSGRHTHNGSLVVFGIGGRGETLMDDERVSWERGDLILFPVKPGGVEHQHFNRRSPDQPATWLATIFDPFWEKVGAVFKQEEDSPHWEDHGDDDHSHAYDDDLVTVNQFMSDFSYEDWADYEPPEKTETLYHDLIRRRNVYRKQVARSQEAGHWAKVEWDDVEWEWNPHGKVKWYLHPAYDDRSIRSLLYSVQEIPPGSRTGKQLRQGGLIHYILEGEGHSIINGERYAWGKDDYLGLPIKPDGHVVQHFNDDPANPVQFTRAEPYMHAELGVDLGVGFEQLEACPEWQGETV